METFFKWAAGIVVLLFFLLVCAGLASDVYKDWNKALGATCATVR